MPGPSGGLVDAIRTALADVRVEVDVGAIEDLDLGPDPQSVAEAVVTRLVADRRAPRAHDVADVVAALLPTAADIAAVLEERSVERRQAAAEAEAILVALAERLWLQLDAMEERHRSTAASLAGMSESFDHASRRMTSRLNGAVTLLQDELRSATEQLSRDLEALRGELRAVAQLRASVERVSGDVEELRATVRQLEHPRGRPHLTALEGGAGTRD